MLARAKEHTICFLLFRRWRLLRPAYLVEQGADATRLCGGGADPSKVPGLGHGPAAREERRIKGQRDGHLPVCTQLVVSVCRRSAPGVGERRERALGGGGAFRTMARGRAVSDLARRATRQRKRPAARPGAQSTSARPSLRRLDQSPRPASGRDAQRLMPASMQKKPMNAR